MMIIIIWVEQQQQTGRNWSDCGCVSIEMKSKWITYHTSWLNIHTIFNCHFEQKFFFWKMELKWNCTADNDECWARKILQRPILLRLVFTGWDSFFLGLDACHWDIFCYQEKTMKYEQNINCHSGRPNCRIMPNWKQNYTVSDCQILFCRNWKNFQCIQKFGFG